MSTLALLEQLREFLLPGNDYPPNGIAAVRVSERGEMRASAAARWLAFSSQQTIEAGHSAFCWQATLKGVVITDAYQDGHGFARSQLAGLLTLRKAQQSPELDRAELQRYLASLVLSPAALRHHPALEWTIADGSGLQVRDVTGPANAAVDFELDAAAGEIICRARRPRLAGKVWIETPWRAVGGDFRLWRGMRAAHRLEVWWDTPQAPFCYYRSAVTALAIAP